MSDKVHKFLSERYFLPHENSWGELAHRVSALYSPIEEAILNFDFVPSSPTLMHANTDGVRRGTLSSCFPMDIHDSIDGIADALKEFMITTQYGGGIGVDFSKIRSRGENIKSINRPTEGVLPFINLYDSVLDNVSQGGARRGAGMSMLNIDHPDILSFIRAKENISTLCRSNFSVRIDDAFYEQLNKSPDSTWYVKAVVSGESFPLMDDGKEITCKQLWDIIVEKAWKTAEPGIFNKTIAEDRCTVTNVNPLVAANACQEYPNIPYTACSLGSINLSHLVKDGEFDWEYFGELIEKATKFLNQVIDQNVFPIEKIKQTTNDTRPIGLGIMGFAHMLYRLRIPYNSKKAIKLTQEIVRYLTLKSAQTSIGKSYPKFDADTYFKSNERFFKLKKCREIDIPELEKDIREKGIWNSAQTSIAPTGSIAYISECSSGIEPVFSLVHIRRIEKAKNVYENVYIVDKEFERFLDINYPDQKLDIIKEVEANNGSCQKSSILTDKEKSIFVTAEDITPMEHLDILEQAALNCSLSVSKTINLPKTATKEEVSKVYLEAYNRGIIGVTVYREGSREGILLHDIPNEEKIIRTSAPKRPKDLPCDIHELKVDDTNYIVLIGKLDGKLYECFVTKNSQNVIDMNKNKVGIIHKKYKHIYDLISLEGAVLIENIGKHFNDSFSAIARLISAHLRHGTPLQYIVSTINKDTYKRFFGFEKSISRVLKKYIKNGELAGRKKCPECESNLVYIEGCISCENPDCGWSKCG